MIKIRKQGERARIFFDDIDFSTLKIISQNEGIRVMCLVKKVKVKHNTWKQHFEKLKSFNLIYVEKEKQVKKIFLTENGKSLLVIFSQSLTSPTSASPTFVSQKEFNMGLEEVDKSTSQISPKKVKRGKTKRYSLNYKRIYGETSLNNNIQRLHPNLNFCSKRLI